MKNNFKKNRWRKNKEVVGVVAEIERKFDLLADHLISFLTPPPRRNKLHLTRVERAMRVTRTDMEDME